MSDIVERLRHWPAHEQVRTYEREMHIAETGNSYIVKHVIPQSPKPVMQQAADTIEAQAAEIVRLREALELLHDNIVAAFPSLNDLGPLVQARAALKGADT